MLKRFFDIVFSGLGLLLILPIVGVLALAVKRELGSPVFFRQLRAGYKGQSFELIKFRSMLNAVDERGQLRPDNERLTNFGRKIRASSLDEIPELWNVLKGEMSLVGPRPLLLEYLKHYTPEQARRHEVRPGLTGWAQVNGRNIISWEKKFELDVWYVDNQSLWLDLKIIFITIVRVIKRNNITAEAGSTVSKFRGSK